MSWINLHEELEEVFSVLQGHFENKLRMAVGLRIRMNWASARAAGLVSPEQEAERHRTYRQSEKGKRARAAYLARTREQRLARMREYDRKRREERLA